LIWITAASVVCATTISNGPILPGSVSPPILYMGQKVWRALPMCSSVPCEPQRSGQNAGEWVALVTHADLVKLSVVYYSGLPIECVPLVSMDNASATLLAFHPDQHQPPTLLCFSRASHALLSCRCEVRLDKRLYIMQHGRFHSASLCAALHVHHYLQAHGSSLSGCSGVEQRGDQHRASPTHPRGHSVQPQP